MNLALRGTEACLDTPPYGQLLGTNGSSALKQRSAPTRSLPSVHVAAM